MWELSDCRLGCCSACGVELNKVSGIVQLDELSWTKLAGLFSLEAWVEQNCRNCSAWWVELNKLSGIVQFDEFSWTNEVRNFIWGSWAEVPCPAASSEGAELKFLPTQLHLRRMSWSSSPHNFIWGRWAEVPCPASSSDGYRDEVSRPTTSSEGYWAEVSPYTTSSEGYWSEVSPYTTSSEGDELNKVCGIVQLVALSWTELSKLFISMGWVEQSWRNCSTRRVKLNKWIPTTSSASTEVKFPTNSLRSSASHQVEVQTPLTTCHPVYTKIPHRNSMRDFSNRVRH